MRAIGSFCTGYAGLDLAVEKVLGGEMVLAADNAPGACKVLEHRFPHVPNYHDITAINWAEVHFPRIDILTGGFPCQSVSQAGMRAGMREGHPTGLWYELRHAISRLEPAMVVLENVRGLFTATTDRLKGTSLDIRAMGAVLGDLDELGYEASWCSVRACDAGLPHKRERVIIYAWRMKDRGLADWSQFTGIMPRQGIMTGGVTYELDTGFPLAGDFPYTALLPTPNTFDGQAPKPRTHRWYHRYAERKGSDANLREVIMYEYGPALRELVDMFSVYFPPPERLLPSHVYSDGKTYRLGKPLPWEMVNGTEMLSAAFTEWIMGLPAGWVTDVPGITRSQAFTLLGNGVCPPQAELALRALLTRSQCKDTMD